jgi:hypothetical protein
LAGVDGLVTIVESGDASRAFFRGNVHRFEENFKSEFFILLYHLRKAGFINGKSFLPTFFFEFFFSRHLINVSNPPVYRKEKIIYGRIRVSIHLSARWLLIHRPQHRVQVLPHSQAYKERSYT